MSKKLLKIVILLSICITNICEAENLSIQDCNALQVNILNARTHDLHYIEFERDQLINELRGTNYSKMDVDMVLESYRNNFNKVMLVYQKLMVEFENNTGCKTGGAYGG